ncbi:hypothetical protein ABH944_005505 [Caballeronia udeis]|uniref:Uncharacterized protein n=1 Tax=Caballeronia udeis TaxID=1232866 RepID=A0ABW8MN88_9BURK
MHALGTAATQGGVAARRRAMFVITAGTFASGRISENERMVSRG